MRSTLVACAASCIIIAVLGTLGNLDSGGLVNQEFHDCAELRAAVKENHEWATKEFATFNAQILNVQVMLHKVNERVQGVEGVVRALLALKPPPALLALALLETVPVPAPVPVPVLLSALPPFTWPCWCWCWCWCWC